MNNETVDKIMEVVCPICHHYQNKRVDRLNGACPPCPFMDAIAAILAEPQVIVVDGVEWKPSEYTAVNDAMSSIVYLSNLSEEDLWKWDVMPVPPTGETYDTLEAALAAATAAIKERHDD